MSDINNNQNKKDQNYNNKQNNNSNNCPGNKQNSNQNNNQQSKKNNNNAYKNKSRQKTALHSYLICETKSVNTPQRAIMPESSESTSLSKSTSQANLMQSGTAPPAML